MANIKQITLPDNITYNIKDATAIQEPASEGTSGQVLTTDGAGGRTWTTSVTSSTIEGWGFKKISAGTSAPSTLATGEVYLVYEE